MSAKKTSRYLYGVGLALLIGFAIAIPDRNSLTTFHETNASVRLYQLQALDLYDSISIEHVLCRWGPKHSSMDISLDDYGRPYPNKAPGVTALSLPAFVLLSPDKDQRVPFHRLLTVLAYIMGLVPLLIVGLFLLRRLDTDLGPGYGGLLLAVLLLASPFYTLTGLFQDYALATALLIAGFLLLDRGTRWTTFLAGGFAFGLAGACNYMYFVYGGVICVVHLGWSIRQKEPWIKPGLSLLLGALGPFFAVLAYHWSIWGDPFTNPYEHLHHPLLQAGRSAAAFDAVVVLDTLFHGKYGLFFTTPWTLPGLAGLVLMATHPKARRVGIIGLTVFMANWIFCSSWVGSNPDFAAFNRHMAPSYFFIAWGLVYILRAFAFDPLWRTWFPPAVAGTIAISVFYQLTTNWTFPYHSSVLHSPIWAVNIPLFVMGVHLRPFQWGSSTWVEMDAGNGNWGWILLTFLLVVAAFALVAWRLGRYPMSPRDRMTRFFIGILSFALLLIWGMNSITLHPDNMESAQTQRGQKELRIFQSVTADISGSYFVPDGVTWNRNGYGTNRWCHFAHCMEQAKPEKCQKLIKYR